MFNINSIQIQSMMSPTEIISALANGLSLPYFPVFEEKMLPT